jgi:hypothetical protein
MKNHILSIDDAAFFQEAIGYLLLPGSLTVQARTRRKESEENKG